MKLLSILPFVMPIMAVPAFADDIQTLAPVRAVTIYPKGATLTRVISAEMPAGSHRVLFPIPQEALISGTPRIRSTSGFNFGAQEYLPNFVTDPRLVYSPEQTAAFDRTEALKDQRILLSDAISNGTAAVEAAKAQLAFVRSISGSGLESVDVTALADVSAMIGEQVAQAWAAFQTATEALRSDQDALRDLDKQITQAQRDFDRTTPPKGAVGMMAISVDLDTAQTIEFTLDYLVRQASWGVDYDMFLNRDDAKLDVSRKVLVQQSTGEVWSDVELVMSTADPLAQIVPSEQWPSQAIVNDSTNGRSSLSSSRSLDYAESRIIEEPVIIEKTATFAQVAIDGLSITYSYPERVTLSPDEEGALILALDTFQLDAQEFNRAVPRRDKTAFLMTKFTNSTSEPMLPGTTSLYRDGRFVGRGQVGMIPSGAEETLAFGPLEGLRLTYTKLENDTGDTGIISRADTREQALEFTVENLTSEVEVVETLFALPFSEQEDLEVTTRARPKPDALDFEQRRNVGQWLLELKPGEKRTVQVDVEMSWPQGQTLQWQP